MRIKASSVLLCSGGLDSTTLAYWLVERGVGFVPLFVEYGQHCAATELSTLRDVLPPASVSDLKTVSVASVYGGSRSRLLREADLWTEKVDYRELYLPYRTLLLLTLGASVAQSHGLERVYAAFINSNHAQEIDCSTEFFARLAPVFSEYGAVTIELPFRQMSKAEVARIGIALGAPIGKTFSCQLSSRVPCGACPNCVDRLAALAAVREDDEGQ